MTSTFNNHFTTMLIRKLESISTLSNDEYEAVQGIPANVRKLTSGQDIIVDGDTSSQCCLILDGWLCRYKILGEGRRQIFSFHVAGDMPDLHTLHMPVMDHSIGTMNAAQVAFIPHESLRALTLRFPHLGAVLWRDTLIDAGIFREWMAGIGRKSAYGRIAHLFCEMYRKLEAVGLASEHRCPLPLKQADIGDALGLSNVHVNRTLQEMRGRGLITLRGNTLVVHAWDELCRSAEFDATYLHLKKRAAG